jgi:addiction module HigA family antidote
MARPAHPGQFIKMEVIEPPKLSVTGAAQVLGVTRPALSALLNGRAALSSEMALRIEKAFGPKMDTLLRMQTAYEIARARDREREIKIKRYVIPVMTICFRWKDGHAHEVEITDYY